MLIFLSISLNMGFFDVVNDPDKGPDMDSLCT